MMVPIHARVGSPQFSGVSLKNAILEWPRTAQTMLKTQLTYTQVVKKAPKGKQQPVLVLSGFMASDSSTVVLRQFLKDINYRAYATRAGYNIPINPKASVDYYVKRVEEIYAKNKKPVALLGWSLGGVQAREVAKRIPDKISQVITMGSPVNGTQVSKIARDGDSFSSTSQLPDVPTTIIYSDIDGVVSVEDAKQQGKGASNLHVYVPHVGMGVSTDVMKVVADTLAYKMGV